MFRSVPMLQLSTLVLEKGERAVLRHLGKLGVIHLTRAAVDEAVGMAPAPDCSVKLAKYERLLARIKDVRKLLGITQLSDLGPLKVELGLDAVEAYVNNLEQRAGELLNRRNELSTQSNEINALCEQLEPYQGFEIPLDQLGQSDFLHFVTGQLPAANLASLRDIVGKNVALLPLKGRNGKQPLVAVTTQAGGQSLENALRNAGFERDKLPPLQGATPEQALSTNKEDERRLTESVARLERQREELARESVPVLAIIEQKLILESRLLEVEENFVRTDAAVLVTGWVPANDVSFVQQEVRNVTGGLCVVEVGDPPGLAQQEVPVLLSHSRLLRPFERLVTGYGLPNYHELEPTLLVAISYLLMFGMMFGDLGHGAVLAVAGIYFLLTGRTVKVRDASLLIMSGGISSMFFGAAYGSCFGLSQFRRYAIWHDPLEGDPLSVMQCAVIVGIVMISLGVILNIINRLRHGDIIGGFLDKFGLLGIAFYWGAVFVITSSAAAKSIGSAKIPLLIFLGLILAGWALNEPLKYFLRRRAGRASEVDDGLLSACIQSLVEAFEGILSYLANTISFVRLAAYAMSHAALLAAAFAMAAEVKHFAPGGSVLSIVVIVVANLVAIVLEGTIAAVQALRLEYYEFFGKFFSGGGRPFKPFLLTDNIQLAASPSTRSEA